MSKDKDAYWFRHDANARNDLKIKAMEANYDKGYGWYWKLIEILREQRAYKLNMTMKGVWLVLAEELKHCTADKAEAFVTDCIEEYELFVTDGQYMWSESLIRRMEKYNEICAKRSEAGKLGGKASKSSANAKQMLSYLSTYLSIDLSINSSNILVAVGKIYHKLELDFRDDEIDFHIHQYGIETVAGALNKYYQRDPAKIKNPKGYYIGILKNYVPDEDVPAPDPSKDEAEKRREEEAEIRATVDPEEGKRKASEMVAKVTGKMAEPPF